jgi:hypothetical protein
MSCLSACVITPVESFSLLALYSLSPMYFLDCVVKKANSNSPHPFVGFAVNPTETNGFFNRLVKMHTWGMTFFVVND